MPHIDHADWQVHRVAAAAAVDDDDDRRLSRVHEMGFIRRFYAFSGECACSIRIISV